ncbi:MAG: hypothetical protein ABI459_03690, partial [Deltaproteobacteria bacterium]
SRPRMRRAIFDRLTEFVLLTIAIGLLGWAEKTVRRLPDGLFSWATHNMSRRFKRSAYCGMPPSSKMSTIF